MLELRLDVQLLSVLRYKVQLDTSLTEVANIEKSDRGILSIKYLQLEPSRRLVLSSLLVAFSSVGGV